MSNAIERLQSDVYGYLLADDYFATVNVLRISEQQIESDIDSQIALFVATAGKSGASLAVHLPSGAVGTNQTPGPQVELRMEVFVTVNKTINESAAGTNISEGELIARVLQDLHALPLGPAVLQFGNPAFEAVAKGEGITIHRIEVVQAVSFPAVARAARPASSRGAGAITLTSNTSGAAIRYTLNGSFPGLDATLYAAPFSEPSSGTELRAMAHKAGLAPSPILQITL